ncbi:MAG: HipA domain-containing protein, partial [Bacteroidota bacterium]
MSRDIQVYADWERLEGPQQLGTLRADVVRGQETFSFAYDDAWLQAHPGLTLDPELTFFTGPQYPGQTRPNFGMFLDSSPDRWGRMLMDRREALLARQADRPVRPLFEIDYLLGVQDESRMGALRFREAETGPFLANFPGYEAPPFTSIRELQQASLGVEDDHRADEPAAVRWLTLLLAPGSSLGGARPKASVRAPDGSLWIAKFPSRNDRVNSGAWEYVVHQLADLCGIQVPEAQAEQYDGNPHHTFLVKRFDRTAEGRIHFASAMTLLGYQDGHDHTAGGSYLELVEAIETYGAAPAADLRELWRRIVFSVLVSNTDDHLRNHGFLLTDQGWRLSPAYDINPNPQGRGLSLNISETDNQLNLDLCQEVSYLFRWEEQAAQAYIEQACTLVQSWERLAESSGISRLERTQMA